MERYISQIFSQLRKSCHSKHPLSEGVLIHLWRIHCCSQLIAIKWTALVGFDAPISFNRNFLHRMLPGQVSRLYPINVIYFWLTSVKLMQNNLCSISHYVCKFSKVEFSYFLAHIVLSKVRPGYLDGWYFTS